MPNVGLRASPQRNLRPNPTRPIIYDNIAVQSIVMTDDAGYYGSDIRAYYASAGQRTVHALHHLIRRVFTLVIFSCFGRFS